MLLALPVLVLAALCRGPEYDEQYTLFLTGQVVRPAWPAEPMMADAVRAAQAASLAPIALARALRETDVHPPLYFWAVSLWRWLTDLDPRLFSVACALASLALTGQLARLAGVAPFPAMALTLGCYGFVYTGIIARGFSLAMALLLLGAVVLTRSETAGGALRRLGLLATGMAFGAASLTNYLSVFAAAGFTLGRWRGGTAPAWIGLGMAPWLALDLVFFLAQRGARPDQFPPFDLSTALLRLGRYAVANVLGGLPLYVPDPCQVPIAVVVAGLCLALAGLVAWRLIHASPLSPLRTALAGAALAQPLGLLALGAVFNNTPIELRYLAFALPFGMILLADAIGALRRRWRVAVLTPVIALQAASVIGLMLAPETMQPARAVIATLMRLAPNATLLVPFGNDGVGIVGAIGHQAPPRQALLVIRAEDSDAAIRERLASLSRVAIARMPQDEASRATIPRIEAALADPCWHIRADTPVLVAYDRVCAEFGR